MNRKAGWLPLKGSPFPPGCVATSLWWMFLCGYQHQNRVEQDMLTLIGPYAYLFFRTPVLATLTKQIRHLPLTTNPWIAYFNMLFLFTQSIMSSILLKAPLKEHNFLSPLNFSATFSEVVVLAMQTSKTDSSVK